MPYQPRLISPPARGEYVSPERKRRQRLLRLHHRVRTVQGRNIPISPPERSVGELRAKARITLQGNYIFVKRSQGYSTLSKKLGGGIRGKVDGFSRQSRKRLIDTFAKFDKNKVARQTKILFVTLTYQHIQTDAQQAKRHLKTFMERLKRRYPKLWAVWKMEYQNRGAIHFHILLGGVGWLPIHADDGFDAQQAWNEVSGQNANNSLDVERIRSYRGALRYASKYLGKMIEQTPADMGLSIAHNGAEEVQATSSGRLWGIYQRNNVPFANEQRVDIDTSYYNYLLFLSQNVKSVWKRFDSSFTLYTDSGDAIFRQLEELTVFKRYRCTIKNPPKT